jgi:GntR family transcriptional regulator
MNEIHINRSEPIPIHTQLIEQLKYAIESGIWQPGRKIPTVREMAQILRINYNTVRTAYQELERSGYLSAEQGRGTFVAPDLEIKQDKGQMSLYDLIDEALIKAKSMGVSPDAFASAAYTRARLYPKGTPDVSVLFVECNNADMEYYARTIHAGTGIKPETVLIEDLAGKGPAFFNRFDLVATTFFHVAELQELVGSNQAVLALMVAPDYLEVMAQLADLPEGTHVGLICAEQKGADSMKRSLIGTGTNYLHYITAGLDQPEKLKNVFEESDRIFISRLAKQTHQGSWPAEKPLQTYIDDLNDSALRLLRREMQRVYQLKTHSEMQQE